MEDELHHYHIQIVSEYHKDPDHLLTPNPWNGHPLNTAYSTFSRSLETGVSDSPQGIS